MVKSFEHLSDAQLEQYGTDSFPGTSDDAPSIEAHLEDCDYCRSRVLEHQRARFAFQADAAMNATSKVDPDLTGVTCNTPDGPTEDDLRKLAAGIMDQKKALELTQHAARCPRCGSILLAFAEDFSDEVPPEEAESLKQLKSSTAEWQKNLLSKLLPPKD